MLRHQCNHRQQVLPEHSVDPVVLESWTCRDRRRQLPLVDVTRKGLNDYALRNLSNGEFQSMAFASSLSEAVFTTNLLRLIRQDRIDPDKTASHLHEPAPPEKHRESAKFMVPLLAELLHTIKGSAPPEKIRKAMSFHAQSASSRKQVWN